MKDWSSAYAPAPPTLLPIPGPIGQSKGSPWICSGGGVDAPPQTETNSHLSTGGLFHQNAAIQEMKEDSGLFSSKKYTNVQRSVCESLCSDINAQTLNTHRAVMEFKANYGD